MRRTLGTLTIAAYLAIAAEATAQPAPNPEALKHFLEGKRLRDEGRCREALVELEASLEREKSIGAYYNHAVCSEKLGNMREAFLDYGEALQLAKDRKDDREREIRAQVSEFLEKRPHIRLALPRPIPRDLQITVDGDPIPAADLRAETTYFVKAEKPAYIVVATASEYEETRITVRDGVVKDRSLVQVVLRTPEQATSPTSAGAESGGFGWQHGVGIAALVVGAAGVTYSLANFISYDTRESKLLRSFDDARAAAGRCDESTSNCSARIAQRESLRADYEANEQDAEQKTPLWLGAGIGGVLVLGGGVVLLLLSPPLKAKGRPAPEAAKLHVVPTVGAKEQGLSIVGTF